MEPTAVYSSYWRFAAERQAVFFRRLRDPLGPWTSDPIIANYRFTNVYRASDRVSQYLIREVLYREDRSQEPCEIVFRTILFKLFNRIDTWEALEQRLGTLSWRAVSLDEICEVLDRRWASGQKVYSAAYIMPAPQLGHPRKHANHLALLQAMMEDDLPGQLVRATSLHSVYREIVKYPGIGPFLASQYAIDINYSSLLDFSEADFVVAGPGALDGISKCFADTGGRTAEEVIHQVVDAQDSAFKALGLPFQNLFGRSLQPIDCQNLFCEVSKYARVAHPEHPGVTGRVRIKQSYRADARPMPPQMYPPRWGLASSPSHIAETVSV